MFSTTFYKTIAIELALGAVAAIVSTLYLIAASV